MIRISIPARINILGNPSDALEGDYATISAAVDLRAYAEIQSAGEIAIELLEALVTQTINEPEAAARRPIASQRYLPGSYPLPYSGDLDLIKGALNRLHASSPEFRQKASGSGFHLRIWSDVPRQSGLGGSSLIVLLTLGAVRQHFDLNPQFHSNYFLAELTQRVESRELGITCGYADRYVPIFGGLAYIDYRSKLHQLELEAEPFATYERLDEFIQELPIVAVTSGIQHDSGDVHGRLRPRYMLEHAQWNVTRGEPPAMLRIMEEVYGLTWRGKIALLKNDLPAFGELMNRNHRLVDEMMLYCGFKDGAGWANNLLIETALSHGALGAKLTGAGGGGSVFAITYPGQQQAVLQAWQAVAQKNNLNAAQFFIPQLARQGLRQEMELP